MLDHSNKEEKKCEAKQRNNYDIEISTAQQTGVTDTGWTLKINPLNSAKKVEQSYQYGQWEVQKALAEAGEVGKQVVVACPSGIGPSTRFHWNSHNTDSMLIIMNLNSVKQQAEVSSSPLKLLNE